MDNQQPDTPVSGADEEMYDEEIEITREDLITALQEVVSGLADGLNGDDRDSYLTADDLAQNDWFFAGVSDQEGQFAVTMWPAEGEEDMLRIDIGGEDAVHALASNPDQVAALADDFIEGLDEDDYDDEDDDEDDEFDEDDDLDEEDDLDEDEFEDDEDTVSSNGNIPPR